MLQFSFFSIFLISEVIVVLLLSIPALAEVVPDSTLLENSRVNRQGNVRVIEGGMQRGSNLFHSFQEFSVPEGGTALFRNLGTIANIFARVTGSDRSAIDGLIRTNGTANLFLLNPNGILFGDKASLSIGGSFLATTADSIRFDDRTLFSATDTQNSSLLTISAPIGLQFGTSPRAIVNRAAGLRVGVGETLALMGGELRFAGGGITSTNGRVELGAIGANTASTLVDLSVTATEIIPDYSSVQNFQDIQFSNQAFVRASGQGQGLIHLQGRNIDLSNSEITTSTRNLDRNAAIGVDASQSLTLHDRSTIRTLAFSDSPAGNIVIQAADLIDVIGDGSGVFSQVSGTRRGGNVRVETNRLLIRNGGAVSVDTQLRGQAGNVSIRATESIQLLGTAAITDERTPFSTISSRVTEEATGNGGNVILETDRLIARNGGAVEASTFGAGRAGNITIRAEAIELSGATVFGTGVREQISSGIFAQVARGAIANAGDAGSITILTRDLTLLDGAQISSAARTGGIGGDVNINATNSIRLSGQSPNATSTVGRSGIFVSAERTAIRNAGVMNIDTPELIVENNGEISANNFGPDQGGTINIAADRLTIQTGGDIRATSFDTGLAGNVSITASTVNLDRGQLTANTRAGEQSNANIELRGLNLLLLRNQSLISARANNNAAGGNVNIVAANGFVVAPVGEDNAIVADAFEGRGGRIDIDAISLIGLEEQPFLQGNETNDIDASSEFGPPGSVTINQINPDPSQGSIELPTDLIDASSLVSQTCSARGAIARTPSEFMITGRGGLSPSPTQPLNASSIASHWITSAETPSRSLDTSYRAAERSPNPAPPIEAQGWITNAQGEVRLVAETPVFSTASTTKMNCDRLLNPDLTTGLSSQS
jgi:filamentous hemagglutinin family protein